MLVDRKDPTVASGTSLDYNVIMMNKEIDMNNAEKARRAHNIEVFGMDRETLIATMEQNRSRLPMFAAGLLSDVQELIDSQPDSMSLRTLVKQHLNVAKFALFETLED